jgi:membrane protein
MVILYHFGPVSHPPYRWTIPGAALGTAGWLGLVAGFRLFLRLADPGSAYGAVGTFIVLLVFFYLTGIVFIAGAEVNGILAGRFVPAEMDSTPDPGSTPRHDSGEDIQRSDR